MSSRAQRQLAAAYMVETRWTPLSAREVLEHHGWDLDAATCTLDAQRTTAHRYIEQTAMHLRARRVGTDQERAAAHVRADAEVDRRQALLVGYATVAWWGDRRARRAGHLLGWDDAR